jgi:hypothetical protein
MSTIYRERNNRRYEFWTFCDGQRIYLAEDSVRRQLKRGVARLVTL